MFEITCQNCRLPHQGDILPENSGIFKCLGCNSINYVTVFPAALRGIEKGERGEHVIGEEASCFKHPDHAAVVACDECGIYLCALCDLEIEGRHLCPDCLKNGKDNISTVRDKCVLHDDLALTLAVLPVLMGFFLWFAVVVTAPAVVIYSCICWKKVNTPYPRNPWRFYVAIVIAALEIIAIALFIVSIAKNW